MAQERSREALLNFLTWLGDKGYLPKNTAVARKIVATKVFADLSVEEASDVTALDLDSIMTRFENRNRGKYGADSLRTYRSRLRNSLSEFSRYANDPLSFQPKKSLSPTIRIKAKPVAAVSADSASSELTSPSRAVRDDDMSVLPISLRENLTLKVVGLPFDLSLTEAKKIANIILAHASD